MDIKPEPDFLHKTRHDINSAMHVVIGMSDVLALAHARRGDLFDALSYSKLTGFSLISNGPIFREKTTVAHLNAKILINQNSPARV